MGFAVFAFCCVFLLIATAGLLLFHREAMVQRISAAKIEADKENRPIRDGEIQTACQQACPAQVITFGNINDKGSRVATLRGDERTYQVLADLNTRPRTTYVAAVINPNSELEEAPAEHAPAKG